MELDVVSAEQPLIAATEASVYDRSRLIFAPLVALSDAGTDLA